MKLYCPVCMLVREFIEIIEIEIWSDVPNIRRYNCSICNYEVRRI